MAEVLSNSSIIVGLATAATFANIARVGGQGELGGGEITVAAWTEVDVLAESGWILGHLWVVGEISIIPFLIH